MKKLGQLLRDEMELRGMTARQLALAMDLSQTTITRVLAGLSVDIETVLIVCKWLGISPVDAFDQDLGVNDTARRLAVLIHREPALGAVFTAALKEVEDGRMSTEDLRDIIEYATYKIEHHANRRRAASHVTENE